MVTVSSPPPQLSPTSMVEADEVDVRRMDGLLEQLKSSMFGDRLAKTSSEIPVQRYSSTSQAQLGRALSSTKMS
ncbi:hypothetical protein TNCV_1164211 [Trichonephila clavipes]|nr:hypothetical protein TNCV_1164211 [Trichonephila clavipes]